MLFAAQLSAKLGKLPDAAAELTCGALEVLRVTGWGGEIEPHGHARPWWRPDARVTSSMSKLSA